MSEATPFGIYLHIPYCKAKCRYCDFYSVPGARGVPQSYVDALLGKSSWELLQNCYPIKAYTEQKISVALALTDLFLEKLGKGICRIHGGGFAGVIMCVVPEEETENYVSYISEFAGKENVYPMNIRAVGAVHIEK